MTARNLLAIAAVVVVVLLLGLVGPGATPGALSTAHAHLDGPNDCAQCHASGISMADACMACHREIRASLDGRHGLHGQLDEGLARACSDCHGEHEGAGVAPVSRLAFARAGHPGPAGFDHAGLDVPRGGAHADLACERCHEQARAAVPPPGTGRYIGLASRGLENRGLESRCASCHADPHAGDYGGDCASCHGDQRPFREVAAFRHDARFPLEGSHARLACERCHAPQTEFSVAALAQQPASAATHAGRAECSACHASPHAEEFLVGVARQAGLDAGASTCARCHDARDGSFATGRVDVARDAHAATGFPLDPPHDRATCAACHAGLGAADAGAGSLRAGGLDADFHAVFPGRAARDCAACHADPHGGQFAGSAFAERDCLACHGPRAFEPPAFDATLHARTHFPLTGSHLAVGCNDCHVEVGGPAGARAARVFAGTPADCAACHADTHAWALPSAGCAACHTTSSFSQAAAGFEHARWTGVALQGRHAALACAACHPPGREPEADGRTFGRARGSACAACHEDPHAGQFAEDGATDCARCHSVDRAFTDFDHARDGGFALDGAHARLACSACHRPQPLPGGGQAVRFAPLGTQCGDCHAATSLEGRAEGGR